jgi:hypothetical protein
MRLTAPTSALRREVFACIASSISSVLLPRPLSKSPIQMDPNKVTAWPGSDGATFWCAGGLLVGAVQKVLPKDRKV